MTKGRNMHACCGEHRVKTNRKDVNAYRLMETKHLQAFQMPFIVYMP